MTLNKPFVAKHRTPTWWLLRGLFLGVGLSPLTACQASPLEAPLEVTNVAAGTSSQPEEARMWMTVGERRFAITLAENDTAKAFAAQLPLTVDMAELNGNEKHAELPAALPVKASRPGTIRNGDLMLYGSKTLVVFYATFSSSYSYTRLGRVEDPALAEALGQGDARISFTMD